MRIPDFFEPLTGYRIWRVWPGGLLTGVHICEPWAPKQPHRASCQVKFENSTRYAHLPEGGDYVGAPARGCTCGLWAAKSTDNLAYKASLDEHPAAPGFAWGECHLWGRVIEHDEGYRAEFAYPKALQATSDAEALATRYGVPVTAVAVPAPTPVALDWGALPAVVYGQPWSAAPVDRFHHLAKDCLRSFLVALTSSPSPVSFSRTLCDEVQNPSDVIALGVRLATDAPMSMIDPVMAHLAAMCRAERLVEFGELPCSTTDTWSARSHLGSLRLTLDQSIREFLIEVIGCRAGVAKRPHTSSQIQIGSTVKLKLPAMFLYPQIPTPPWNAMPPLFPKLGLSIRMIRNYYLKGGL